MKNKLLQMIVWSFCFVFLIKENFIGFSLGKDKGVYGELFEITEKDLLEEITGKLKRLETSGELKGIDKNGL